MEGRIIEVFSCDSGSPSSIIRRPKFSWEEVTSHDSIGPFSPTGLHGLHPPLSL